MDSLARGEDRESRCSDGCEKLTTRTADNERLRYRRHGIVQLEESIMEELLMKSRVVRGFHFFVLLVLLWPGAATGNMLMQSRKSDHVALSPEAWPQGELEKYQQLQRTYFRSRPAAESSQGMVAVTSEAFAARVGLEALQQGGSAADAALATALAQVALTAGSTISYAGILTLVYYDAAGQKVYSLNAGYNTVQAEDDPRSIPGLGKASGRTALVPGFFAGVQAAHDRFGKLPFASLFEPAIYLAEKGFIVDEVLGGR